MNETIDTAAAGQLFVGRIHDGVDLKTRNVATIDGYLTAQARFRPSINLVQGDKVGSALVLFALLFEAHGKKSI